jgi:putative ABC transport system permease protein
MRSPDEVVRLVEAKWKKHFPVALFDYDFVSQQIKHQYLADERFSKIFLYFSILSLVIACLGLYGLISYTIFQRTKEIGIRKIMGANTRTIAAMLSTDLLRMLLLSCLIATPVAWLVMNRWLQNFAYRTSLSSWMFAAGELLVFLIAFATISARVIKGAMANPINNLRTE